MAEPRHTVDGLHGEIGSLKQQVSSLDERVKSIEHYIAVITELEKDMKDMVKQHQVLIHGDGKDAGMKTELIILERQNKSRRAWMFALVGILVTESLAFIGGFVLLLIQMGKARKP